MKLFDRLKPEYLEKLEIIKNDYPIMYEKINNSLNGNQSVFALTLDEASSICVFLNMETTLNNLLSLFIE
jgi:hypothetical protein